MDYASLVYCNLIVACCLTVCLVVYGYFLGHLDSVVCWCIGIVGWWFCFALVLTVVLLLRLLWVGCLGLDDFAPLWVFV